MHSKEKILEFFDNLISDIRDEIDDEYPNPYSFQRQGARLVLGTVKAYRKTLEMEWEE